MRRFAERNWGSESNGAETAVSRCEPSQINDFGPALGSYESSSRVRDTLDFSTVFLALRRFCSFDSAGLQDLALNDDKG